MFAFAKGANTGTSIYDNFTLKSQELTNKIRDAIEMDEQTKQHGSIEAKIRTATLYKEARSIYKEAINFNIMDIPESKRSEVRTTREKLKKFDVSAQDRILAICNEVDPKSRQTSSVAASQIRRPSPAAQPLRTPRSAPVEKKTVVKKVVKTKQNDENVHVCSRGDRCGAHHPPGEKKKKKATSAVKKPLVQTSKTVETTDVSLKTQKGALNAQHNSAVNRAALLKGVDPKIGERLLDEVLENTGVGLADVAGCQTAKSALEEAVILPSLNPDLFSGLRQPVKGILLFGPPGNGKTLLAKAVAGDANTMFFNISASSLTSKWVGDSEKTIRGLFQIARNAQPSIIFIDEIDSILCERSEKDAEVSRRMKTEFLVQFDGATSSADDRILVIGATNRPYELDDAVLRRFPKRILLNLPDEQARRELITMTLRKHNMMEGLTDRDIRYIASSTSGFSNSDLVALCKEAAMVPIREIDKSKLSMTDGRKLRGMRASDFDKALRTIRPSTSEKIMSKLSEFSRNFGC